MSEKKLIIFLSILCFSLFFVYVFSFVFDKNSPEKITSALVNPKYAEKITSFSVESSDGKLEFFLIQDVWFGAKKDMIFPIFQGASKELIKQLTQIREMYIITKKASLEELKLFALDEKQSVKICIKTGEDEIITSVYFGGYNFIGNKIYVRGKTPVIYEIQDVFSPWLSVEPRQWADMELLPKSLIGNISSKDIQRVAVSIGEKSKVAYPVSKEFENFTNTILSLRAGNILSKGKTGLEEKIGFIELDLGTGGKITLEIYKKSDDDSVYYVDFMGIEGIAEKNRAEVLNQSNYVLEISSWTFDRIIELFNNLV